MEIEELVEEMMEPSNVISEGVKNTFSFESIDEKDLNKLTDIRSELSVIKELRASLESDGAVCRDDVANIHKLYPEILDDRLTLEQFTTFKSKTNYRETISFIVNKEKELVSLFKERKADLESRLKSYRDYPASVLNIMSGFFIETEARRLVDEETLFSYIQNCGGPKVLSNGSTLISITCGKLSTVYDCLFDYRTNPKMTNLSSSLRGLFDLFEHKDPKVAEAVNKAINFLYVASTSTVSNVLENMEAADYKYEITLRDIFNVIISYHTRTLLLDLANTVEGKLKVVEQQIAHIYPEDAGWDSNYQATAILEAEASLFEIETISDIVRGMSYLAPKTRGILTAYAKLIS